ncbi:MAG TPA: ammonium transporter [Burkholderiales bacterium]|nr:ammonium transporter [Burkholderiales bacterium]
MTCARRWMIAGLAAGIGGLGWAVPALAEGEAASGLNSGDVAWILTSSAIVLMMTIPGLALFYGGLVRAKNVLSVLMQCLVCAAVVSVTWVLWGYSLAFGPDHGGLIGDLSHFGLAGVSWVAGPDENIPPQAFMVFQLMFAIITPALIVGAFAERIKFSAVLWFMVFWLFLCYIPIAHMVWGGGFLSAGLEGMGFAAAMDFAGGTVVHINAGIAALVGCIVIGKRIGYGKEAMPPHNLTFTMVGASLLWVGWYGFNVGSELAADGTAGLVLINTQLATAAAVLGWLFIEWIARGKPTMLGGASGAVAGLVAITPACAFVGPMGAIVLGAISGIVCFWAVTGLKSMFNYDDSLDVFGVHGVGGIIGAIGTGFLASTSFGGGGYAEGVGMGGQVTTQIISVLVTIVWTGVISFILFKIIDSVIGLRVPEDEEREGIDATQHGEAAYHT